MNRPTEDYVFDKMEGESRADQLLAAMRTLSPEQFEAVLLSFLGFREKDIAADTGMSKQAVWYRRSAGLKRVRRRCEQVRT